MQNRRGIEEAEEIIRMVMDFNKIRALAKVDAFRKQNPSLKFKIGKTGNPTRREKEHLQNGFICFLILHRVNTVEEMDKLEKQLIHFFKNKSKCLNKSKGGEGDIRDGSDYCVYLIAKR